MAGFGVLVLLRALQALLTGQPPEPVTMGVVACWRWPPTWPVPPCSTPGGRVTPICAPCGLCTRNDALGNVAVVGAALGVFGSGAGWPDLVVATGMAVLALHSARAA